MSRIVLMICLLLIEYIKCNRFSSSKNTENIQTTMNTPDERFLYKKPEVTKGKYHFLETFDTNTIGIKWFKSLAKKQNVAESIAKYDGEWSIEPAVEFGLYGDYGLVLKSKVKHHALSARLIKEFDFTNRKPLIIQYEVKFQMALVCGGAYVKLFNERNINLEQVTDTTPYTIMFGPDKCGAENKLHFILKYKNPLKDDVFEEKRAKKTDNIESYFTDDHTHLYTLILRPNNKYEIMVDQIVVNSGSLLKDMEPPINPEKEIDDPDDTKPDTWDDREEIEDENAVKPEDWDETEPKELVNPKVKKPDGWLDDESPVIPDPYAIKPSDWNEEIDGEWEAPKIDNPKCKYGCGEWSQPMIKNPKYKGKWKPPMIPNQKYQGEWKPRKIPNPDYYEDNDPFKSITSLTAIGLELWSMTDNIFFDNFIITDDESVAFQFAEQTWARKCEIEYKPGFTVKNIINLLLRAAKESPWMWALYFLIVFIPTVLISFICFDGNIKPIKQNKKKTDAPTKDSPIEEAMSIENQKSTKSSTVNGTSSHLRCSRKE